MPLVCSLPAGTTAPLINRHLVYSCPLHYTRLKEQNTKKAPFYAFRSSNRGEMAYAWKAAFDSRALRITPSHDEVDIRRQIEAQRSTLLQPSTNQVQQLLNYIEESLALAVPTGQNFAQEQYYHFLLPKPGRQPASTNLPYPSINSQGMSYFDLNDFLSGGPISPAH